MFVTLFKRRSEYAPTRKAASKGADEVASEIIDMLMPYRPLVRRLTSDNGLEFARHADISRAIDCKFFFARPYASWQRGSNEDLNGLLRQYFPKRSSFTQVTPERVLAAQRQLNDRARKRLDWATPSEVFETAAKRLGVALAS